MSQRRRGDADLHARTIAWLLAGAQGDPSRDMALHASLCDTCGSTIEAIDALGAVNLDRAPLPPSRLDAPAPESAPTWGVVAAAVAGLMLVAAVGAVGASLLPGLVGLGGASPTPGQEVLGGVGSAPTATATASPSPTDSPASDTPSPDTPSPDESGTPPPTAISQPTPRPPTPLPPTPTPTTRPTPASTRTPAPTVPATPTSTPTATPTSTPATPTPAPLPPQCSDLQDNDGDELTDWPDDPDCTGPLDDDESA